MVYETIGTMILNVSLMTGGALFGILGMLFGFSRGMTPKSDMWALIFASFAWALALAIPSAPFSFAVFLAGALAITATFTPVIKNIPESNVFIIAIIAILVNFTMVIGFGSYGLVNHFSWESNLAASEDLIESLFSEQYNKDNGIMPDSGLCELGDSDCTDSAQKGTFESTVFDVFATYLAVPTYIGKAIDFAGAGLFAPIVIGQYIAPKMANSIVYYFVALYILIWEIAIFYKTVVFILKRTSNL